MGDGQEHSAVPPGVGKHLQPGSQGEGLQGLNGAVGDLVGELVHVHGAHCTSGPQSPLAEVIAAATSAAASTAMLHRCTAISKRRSRRSAMRAI